MKRALLIFAILAVASPASAVVVEGTTNAGAAYKIETPDGWQAGDGLVLYNRGFRSAVQEDPGLGPLRERQLAQGFAVAASGFSQGGWALFATDDDNHDLLRIFSARFGEPGSVYAYGGSMGGLVTAQLAEDPRLDLDGALALCGVVGGTRVWDSALDLRLAYDEVCGSVPGAELPGGEGGYSFVLDERFLDGELEDLAIGTLGLAINICTGISLPDLLRTSSQDRRLDRLLSLSNMDEEFFLTNMGYSTLVLSDLYLDPDKLNLGPAVDNRFADYADADLDASIERVGSNPLDRFYLRRNFSPTGAVGETRVIAINTDADDLVWLENLGEYQQTMASDRLVSAIVDEDEPSHCGFSEAEVFAGWDALLDWTTGASPQPSAADLDDRCAQLVADGMAIGPCRLESAQGVGDFNDRVAPRNLDEPMIDGGYSGAWFDPDRSGEGWLVEVLDRHRALVYWFTYPEPGSQRQQRWLVGEGRITDFGYHVDAFEEFAGGNLGGDFDPDNIERTEFGSTDFVFSGCNQGQVRIFPGTDEARDQPLARLSALADTQCATDAPGSNVGHFSGSWFDPAKPGEGWIVQGLDDGRVNLVWFTYTANGDPAWYTGTGIKTSQGFMIDQLDRPVGARFGEAFDPGDVVLENAGSLLFESISCDSATISWSLTDDRAGSSSVVRLTQPAQTTCSTMD